MTDYHDHPAVSATGLGIAEYSMRDYYHQQVVRDVPRIEATRRMERGTATHLACLEPHRFAERIVEIPDELLSGTNRSISSAAAKDWVSAAKLRRQIPLKGAEIANVRKMAEAVLKHEHVGQWLTHPSTVCEAEQFWQCDETGLECRCKPDAELADFGLIVDLKCTGTPLPAEFNRTANSMGYALRAAHYLDDREEFRYLFVAVGTEAPFHVVVYEYGPEDLEQAAEQRMELLRRIKHGHETGDWSDEFSKNVNRLRLWRNR